MAYVLLGCRWLVALVFLASIGGKLHSRGSYADFVAATRRLVPRWVSSRVPVRGVAVGVVAAEVAVLVLLAVPGMVAAGLALAGLLSLGFGAAIASALRRGERSPCHCFGSSTRRLGGGHLLRNLLLVLAAAAGVVAAGIPVEPLAPATTAVVLVAGAVAAALLVAIDDLIDLFRPSIHPVPDHREWS